MVWYTFVAGSAVRFALKDTVRFKDDFTFERYLGPIVVSEIFLTILLTIHLKIEPLARAVVTENARVWIVLSVYTLMLAFGAYFVALFYDFSGVSTTFPNIGGPHKTILK